MYIVVFGHRKTQTHSKTRKYREEPTKVSPDTEYAGNHVSLYSDFDFDDDFVPWGARPIRLEIGPVVRGVALVSRGEWSRRVPV